jgi:hypothetical protein
MHWCVTNARFGGLQPPPQNTPFSSTNSPCASLTFTTEPKLLMRIHYDVGTRAGQVGAREQGCIPSRCPRSRGWPWWKNTSPLLGVRLQYSRPFGRGVAPGKHKKSTRPRHAPAPPPAAAPAFCWSWKVRRARRTFAPAPRCSVAMARCTAGVRDTPADPRWGPRALKLDVLAEVCAGRAVHAHVNTDAHRYEKGCGAACRGGWGGAQLGGVATAVSVGW